MQNHKSVVQKWLSYCNLKTCKNTIFFQSLHICVQCVIFYRHGSVLSTLPKIIRCHPHSLQNNAKQDQASKAPSAVSPIIFFGCIFIFLDQFHNLSVHISYSYCFSIPPFLIFVIIITLI